MMNFYFLFVYSMIMHAYMVKLHGKFRILGIYLLLEYWNGEDRIEKTATETKVLGLKFKKRNNELLSFPKTTILFLQS